MIFDGGREKAQRELTVESLPQSRIRSTASGPGRDCKSLPALAIHVPPAHGSRVAPSSEGAFFAGRRGHRPLQERGTPVLLSKGAPCTGEAFFGGAFSHGYRKSTAIFRLPYTSIVHCKLSIVNYQFLFVHFPLYHPLTPFFLIQQPREVSRTMDRVSPGATAGR